MGCTQNCEKEGNYESQSPTKTGETVDAGCNGPDGESGERAAKSTERSVKVENTINLQCEGLRTRPGVGKSNVGARIECDETTSREEILSPGLWILKKSYLMRDAAMR